MTDLRPLVDAINQLNGDECGTTVCVNVRGMPNHNLTFSRVDNMRLYAEITVPQSFANAVSPEACVHLWEEDYKTPVGQLSNWTRTREFLLPASSIDSFWIETRDTIAELEGGELRPRGPQLGAFINKQWRDRG